MIVNENQPTFSPEARAELLAMYTGMAMQGILTVDVLDRPESVAKAAVAQANATVDALEAYHINVAKQANATADALEAYRISNAKQTEADDKLLADLGVSYASASQ